MSRQPIKWTTIVAPEIIELNETTQIRIEVTQGGDKKGLSIRQWFRGTQDKTGPNKLKVGPWLPTKKGVWIPITRAMEVHAALTIVLQNYSHKQQETL